MIDVTLIGLCAAALTTCSLLPQLIKIHKTKSTEDISLGTYLLSAVGVFLWLVYGVLINALPIILANFITFSLTVLIIIYKLNYK